MEQFSQHVNFYLSEFQKQKIFLSAKQLLIILGVCLLLFLALSVTQTVMINELKASASIAVKQKDKMNNQLLKLQSEFVEAKEDPKLRQEIVDFNGQIRNKKRLVEFLGGQSSKKLFSFSSVMNGLSEKTVGGIWLTELSMKTEGSRYRLVGNAQQPDLLPLYIDQLKTSTVLKGTSFNLFDLERVDKGKGYLKFILSSEGDSSESEVTLR